MNLDSELVWRRGQFHQRDQNAINAGCARATYDFVWQLEFFCRTWRGRPNQLPSWLSPIVWTEICVFVCLEEEKDRAAGGKFNGAQKCLLNHFFLKGG